MSGKAKREYHAKQAEDAEHGGKDKHSGQQKGKNKGQGGKGAWSKVGMEDLRYIDDEVDYDNVTDEEKEGNFFMEAKEFADPIQTIIREFYLGADFEDANKAIKEAIQPEQRPRFVKKTLHLSMDLRAYERELTSKLISECGGNALSRDEIADGFQLALDDLPETVIDVPQAVDMLGKFIARAILDEVLPPIFLEQAEESSNLAKECLNLANGALKAPNFGPALAHVWGPGDMCSVKRMVKECNQLLDEFLSTNDKSEALACIQKLNAPSFHPRLVRELLRLGFERGEDAYDKMLELLKSFYDMGVVSQYNIGRGFQIVHIRKNDYKLDFPKIDILLPLYTEKARALQLLPKE
jgi:programmed cell death protein 4